jgi:sugar phosphate isomerase/epimerase
MKGAEPSRRALLAATAASVAACSVAMDVKADDRPADEPFGYCLNMATLRGQNLPLAEEIEIAAKAGFGAIEPWVSEIDKHVQKGGTTADLRKRIADHGMKVPSAIAFAEWIVDDDAKRAKGLEQMKRDMDAVAQIGGTHIAAPPAGVSDKSVPALEHLAERYRAILDLGKQMGVTPELELWGFSKVLNRIGEVAQVAIDSGGEGACLLLDVYHLYKGGSDVGGVKLLNGNALGVLHTNDYPDMPRAKINDSFRVYPGDGVAPLGELYRILREIGYRGYLSVELFNKDYWRQSPQKVANAAIEKTRASVKKALSESIRAK